MFMPRSGSLTEHTSFDVMAFVKLAIESRVGPASPENDLDSENPV
jgi:hypothetical protein